MSATCHLCGGDVPNTNDKGILLALVYENPLLITMTKCQHVIAGLYPGTSTHCPGSPSLAQYIPGQRQDTRTGPDGALLYPIVPDALDAVRKAWARMQELGPRDCAW